MKATVVRRGPQTSSSKSIFHFPFIIFYLVIDSRASEGRASAGARRQIALPDGRASDTRRSKLNGKWKMSNEK